jgi:O-antigen/teichoic acid export membrane protein
VADLAQLALVTHALGLRDYGRLALATGFVILVGQFFDVRVGAVATTFGAKRLEQSPESAAGVFQLSYLIDLATGVLGFLVVGALAPWVGPALVGDEGTALIVLYALTLLASTVDESSITVLRLLDRFRLIARYTLVLEAIRIGLVAGALVLFHSLTGVVLALLAYRVMAGAVNALAATGAFRRSSGGRSLTRPALASVAKERPAMLRMMLHTNVVSYARLAQGQLPTIVIGALVGATQAGLYKVGMAGAAVVGRLADPAYVALLPRISRLWAASRRREVRELIARGSLVSVPVMALAFTVLVLLSSPVLSLLGGGKPGQSADSVLVFAALAQAINGALFWNIGVLFAAGESKTVSRLAILGVLIQLASLPPLVLALDAPGAALAFLISTATTNLLIGWQAIRMLRQRPPAAPPVSEDAELAVESLPPIRLST